jgi:glycosyltransferase involved in cell wall biosynthesis
MSSVWMIVSSGYYDDVRVQKSAGSVAGFGQVTKVVVLAMNRSRTAPNAATIIDGREVEVRLFGHPQEQFDSRIAKLRPRAAFLWWAYRSIRREIRSGDTIHCHDLDTAPVGLAARGRHHRLILDLHEVYSGRSGLGPMLRRLLQWLESWILPRADGVVFVSGAAQRHYREQYRLAATAVVTNSRSAAEVTTAPALCDRARRLVYVGRFSGSRGLTQSVKAMASLGSDYTLDLIGFGPLEGTLRDLAAGLPPDAGRVRVLAPVPLGEVVATLGSYDLGLVLTEIDCLNHQLTVSNKLFEYAAAGLPVVLSAADEHLDILREYPIGVVTEVTPGAIATAVRSVSNDGPFLALARSAAGRLATERAWENEARGLQGLYATVWMTHSPV